MKRKRGFSLVLCLFLLSCLLPQAVGAERIDPERECSLTVELYEDGTPVEGFPFGLFYAASVRAQGGFTLAGDFQDCPVEINGLTAAPIHRSCPDPGCLCPAEQPEAIGEKGYRCQRLCRV